MLTQNNFLYQFYPSTLKKSQLINLINFKAFHSIIHSNCTCHNPIFYFYFILLFFYKINKKMMMKKIYEMNEE